MSQHDYTIDNADGATVRADINSVLEAVASNNSGATAPPVTFPYMRWFDTTNQQLKERNGANTAWRIVADVVDGEIAVRSSGIRLTTSSTGSLLLPNGTTAQRDAAPEAGLIRYNNETNTFEGYQNGQWGQIGGGRHILAVEWEPSRDLITDGFVAYDGQTLSRATYQDMYDAAVAAGLVETEATWQADPAKRGKFSDGDGSTTFRVPDFNGKSAGSLGAVYLTGDGHKTAGSAGTIREDEMQRITGEYSAYYSSGTNTGGPLREGNDLAGAFTQGESTNLLTSASSGTGYGLEFDSALSPDARTNTYTHGTDVSGVWCGRAFGAVVNVGSADAAQLASDYANLAGRVSALEAEPGIGWNQTWQDVTASRSTGVTYTNSTGAPIQLAISLSPGGAGRDILIDGQMIARTDSSSNIGNHYIVVPDGSSYELSGGTISKWWELR